MLQFETASPDETEQLGARLGSQLRSGDVVTLVGELGGGKTCFVRGVVQGACPACADQVASPTYALMHHYDCPVAIYHYDCYRLSGADDALEIGLIDQLNGNGICLVEWPERISSELPADHLEIRFSHAGDDHRRISFLPHGFRARELAAQLAQSL